MTDELAHHGVKGMKWGIRKDRKGRVKARSVGRRSEETTNQRPRGYSSIYTGKRKSKAIDKVYTKSARKLRRGTRRLNRDSRFKDKDLRKNKKLRDQYHKEFSKMVEDQLNASAKLYGTSKGGQYRLEFSYDVSKNIFPEAGIRLGSSRAIARQERKEARATRRFKHSETNVAGEYYPIELKAGPLGHVVDFVIPEELSQEEVSTVMDLIHSDLFIESRLGALEDHIEHAGVKGMKWGVITWPERRKRRRAEERAKAGNKPKKQAKPKPKTQAKPKASTGESSKKSQNRSTKPLSNQELREQIERIKLEREYASLLAPQPQKKAESFIVKSLREGTGQAIAGTAKTVGTYAMIKGFEKATKTKITVPKK